MIHPDKEKISLLAEKQIHGELLSDDDLTIKSHFNECKECKDYFIDCMSADYFFASDEMDYYYATSFAGNFEKKILKAKERIAYSIQIVIDRTKKNVELACDYLAESLPAFQRELAPAMARGVSDENLTEWTAGESLIRYDLESGILTVLLDEDDVGEEQLIAVVKFADNKIEKAMENDGHGMVEAVFEDIYDGKFELVISKKS